MASYPEPNPNIHVYNKKISIGKKSLRMLIHESEDTFTLYIGGYTMFCIDALIHKETSRFSRIIDVQLGYLSHVYYNQTCSLEHNFVRGIDTNRILKILCTYVKNNFPYIKGFIFNDTSTRPCDNGSYINLYEMSYIRTGKTWYEKHFHAYIHPTSLKLFIKTEKEFQEKKKLISWDMMKTYIQTPLPMDESILQTLYDSTNTWQEFFDTISNTIEIDTFCIFVSDWLHGFMMSIFQLDLATIKYIMPIDINTIEYTESSYKQGGSRFTRKHIYRQPRNEI